VRQNDSGRELALAIDELLREHLVRIEHLGQHRQGFVQTDVRDARAPHRAPHDAVDRFLRALVVGREVGLDLAVRKRHDRHSIDAREPIDERLGGVEGRP
jgi:hypothetical protein